MFGIFFLWIFWLNTLNSLLLKHNHSIIFNKFFFNKRLFNISKVLNIFKSTTNRHLKQWTIILHFAIFSSIFGISLKSLSHQSNLVSSFDQRNFPPRRINDFWSNPAWFNADFTPTSRIELDGIFAPVVQSKNRILSSSKM